MTQAFRDAVVETLRDRRLQAINFGYKQSFVYATGYADVANLVRDGHIRFEYSGGGDNAFAPDTPLGTPHVWYVNRDLAEPDGQGHLRIRGRLGSGGRGTIVHEATHALQDYQRLHAEDRLGRSGFSAESAEGAAHIAGWMARLLWGWPRPGPNDGTHGTIAYARSIAAQLLDGTIGPIIPESMASTLNGYASQSIGSRHRYVFLGYFPPGARD